MAKKKKTNHIYEYRTPKDYRYNINLSIHEYNFYYDFDDRFFSYKYLRMWKHICLFVEEYYWEEIEKETIEFIRKFYLDFLVSYWINEENIKRYLENLMEKTEYEIRKKKTKTFYEIYERTSQENKYN